MRRAVILSCLFTVAGCGGSQAASPDALPCASGNLPPSWTLSAPGITVAIQRSPYQYQVEDANGRVVLASLGPGKQDGYGAVGWTTGTLTWSNIVSPGYFSMKADLDPWRDDWQVVAAARNGPRELDVTLSAAGQSRCIHERYILRDGTLRVEASLGGAGKPPRAWSAAFKSPKQEAFSGFGERFNRVDQRGLTLYSWPEEGGIGKSEADPAGPENPWPNGETMTYYPVPFFLSTDGYGFWLDTTWRNEFRLASDRADAWRVRTIGPKLAYEIYVPVPGDPRPWTAQVVDRFTATTGRPMMPPKWTLGPRRRIDPGSTVGGVPEIQAMRDDDLAITALDDAVHFLPAGSDVGKESALAAWVKQAAALGYRVDGYYNPYISKDSSPLDSVRDLGLESHWFLADKSGKPSLVWLISGHLLSVYTLDFTNPAATAWYTKMFHRAFDLGYSGWMYDFGEYVQPDVVAYNGMTGEQLHNLFPVLYQKAAHDALEAGPHKGNWLTFVRSGYTGASQYSPMVWSGDPDASFDDALGLPAMVRAAINIGISGVPNWGSDIGGFKCNGDGHAGADGELIARWIEFGSMTMNMQDQNACNQASDPGYKATIWSSTDAHNAWHTYARLHTRLEPYLYGLAEKAHATGVPPVRSLYFEHPERDLAGIGDEFYLGPAILVAPVVHRGARSRDVVLPEGKYLAWPDGTLETGPGTVTAAAPLDKLPLYLADGHLVPLLDPTIDTLNHTSDPDIVGPEDVADVYDVVGLLSTDTGKADFSFADGGKLSATWSGAFAPPSLPMATSAAELSTCDGCWLSSSLPGGVTRVRISVEPGTVTAGGLTLSSDVNRRIRWDLYLVGP